MGAEIAYTVVATIIFVIVAFTFLFPCNVLIPLDRRTISVVGALGCYMTRRYLFPSRQMDLLDAVDFDVMILLSSIMVINYIVVHLKETRGLIEYLQNLVRQFPIRGFWLISFSALIASPFLTNDGVCLLFVEPILNAFEEVVEAVDTKTQAEETADPLKKLEAEDAIYFLLTLACSSNIGSALTYTGNPQNMIVASDSINVLPSYKFTAMMLLPSLFAWLVTTKYIERCWSHAKLKSNQSKLEQQHLLSSSEQLTTSEKLEDGSIKRTSLELSDQEAAGPVFSPSSKKVKPLSLTICVSEDGAASPDTGRTPLSPRRLKTRQREKMYKGAVRLVASPFPYMVLLLLLLMIVMIFVDLMPISGLICLFSVIMILTIVLGNHWRDQTIWIEDQPTTQDKPPHKILRTHGRQLSKTSVKSTDEKKENEENIENTKTHKRKSSSKGSATYNLIHEQPPDTEEDLGPLTKEDKLDNLNTFFHALFESIDYSILIIFMGLFIVVENMSSTGVPKYVWDKIVGETPFKTFSSVVGISIFVLISSQFLGNVAVVQLAKPNVHYLDDQSKAYAWAVISFVSTVGGNLTITGSAANIIVAEKASRLDATLSIDFFRHFKVCFWITLLSCTVGAVIITALFQLDSLA